MFGHNRERSPVYVAHLGPAIPAGIQASVSSAGLAPAIDPHPRAPYTAALSERVAQMVEHVTFNHGVLGSIPSALTNKINYLHLNHKIRNKPRVCTVSANQLPAAGRVRCSRISEGARSPASHSASIRRLK